MNNTKSEQEEMQMDIHSYLVTHHYTTGVEDESLVSLFNSWTASNPDYLIHIVQSEKSKIHSIYDSSDKRYHIIWDTSYWDYLIYYYYICDEQNFFMSEDSITVREDSGFIIALFMSILAKRYSMNKDVSARLMEQASHFRYDVLHQCYEMEKEQYEGILSLSKIFYFFREIALCEFQKYDEVDHLYNRQLDALYQALQMINGIDNNYRDSQNTMHQEIVSEIMNRRIPENIEREMAADLRSIQRIIDMISASANKKKMSNLIKAVQTVVKFSVIKSTVEEQWDFILGFSNENPMPRFSKIQVYRMRLFATGTCLLLSLELGMPLLHDIKEMTEYSDYMYIAIYELLKQESVSTILHNESLNGDTGLKFLDEISRYMQTITEDMCCRKLKYLFNQAHAMRIGDNPMESIPVFKKFIALASGMNGFANSHIADAYSRIARTLADQKTEKLTFRAEYFLLEALDMIATITEEDISISYLFNNIGNVFGSLRDYHISNGNDDQAHKMNVKAFEYYQKSLRSRLRGEPIESLNLSATYFNLGSCEAFHGGHPRAMRYYLAAYSIISPGYDRNDPTYTMLVKALQQLAEIPSNVWQVHFKNDMPLETARKAYEAEPNSEANLYQYMTCMTRDILRDEFNDAVRLYLTIFDLLEKKNYPRKFFETERFAFLNMRSRISEYSF